MRLAITVLLFLFLPLYILLSGCSSGGGDSTPPPPPAPSVIAVTPSENSDTALVTTVVTAQFSEQMDSSTVDENSFTLLDSSMIKVAGDDRNGVADIYRAYNAALP